MPYSTVPTGLTAGSRYMSGNEAAAEAAIAAGCRFYAGYPITPSSEIMENLAKLLPAHGGAFIQMEDEIGSISAVCGASWSGAKAMTATSGPGLSLMQECLGYSAFTETPLVVVDVQRAGPSTGQATKVGGGDIMTVKYGSHGDYQVVAFAPWSVAEMFSLTVEAFNAAEMLRVPAFVLAEEATGHLFERVDTPSEVRVYDRDYRPGEPPFDTPELDGVPSMPRFGQGENLLVTGSTHNGPGLPQGGGPRGARPPGAPAEPQGPGAQGRALPLRDPLPRRRRARGRRLRLHRAQRPPRRQDRARGRSARGHAPLHHHLALLPRDRRGDRRARRAVPRPGDEPGPGRRHGAGRVVGTAEWRRWAR